MGGQGIPEIIEGSMRGKPNLSIHDPIVSSKKPQAADIFPYKSQCQEDVSILSKVEKERVCTVKQFSIFNLKEREKEHH